MRTLLPLAAGGALVAAVAAVLLIAGWSWGWFAAANGVLTVVLLAVFRGSVTGADERRPPGVARASAARVAGPFDPDELGAREAALEPDHEAAAEARAEDLRTGFGALLAAVPPAAAAVVALVFFL